jgi:uncharacterized protein involved in outer membrane biogenesis
MKKFLRRAATAAAVTALLALVGVALAPWWIDLAFVRTRIERAASTALAGKLSYERIGLSWLPRPEVVVRSLRISIPGVRGAIRTVRVSPSLLPLFRGRVVITNVRVDGLDLAVDLSSSSSKEPPAPPSESDWTAALRSLGDQTLDVGVSESRVVLSRAGRGSLALEGLHLNAGLHAADSKATVALSRLSLVSPRLDVEGSVRLDAAARRVEAEARGTGLDVTDVRAKLLAFAGDDRVIAEILGIFRGGTLKSFSFASSGKEPAELGVLERMTIRAAVENGQVRIPGPDLDLAEVRADVALEEGVLRAEHAEARVGTSRAREGTLLLGLSKGDDRLRVEADVQADLAGVPAILARVIPSASFRREVALVEGLAGSATGKITIGELKSDLRTNVDLSRMRLSARYRPLPSPFAVRSGRFSFDGASVGVSGMTGSLGLSTFEGVAARVGLGKTPSLEVSAGGIDMALEDFLEGARSIPSAASLVENVRRLQGSVHVDVRRVRGPLARLGEASLSASGTFEEILFESSSSSSLPPLSIASGRFAVTDDAIRVSDVAARALDASLRVTGAWSGYRKGRGTIEAAADGVLGAEAVRWGWERASLPSGFRPAAPVSLRGTRFGLAPDGAFSLAGDFVVADGPRLTLDLAGNGKTAEVRDLTIIDGKTKASFSLARPGGDFDARFRGTLELATIRRILEERPLRRGTLAGDLQALVPAESPFRLAAEGTLTATDLEVLTPAGAVAVERAEVRASGSRADVGPSTLVFDGQRFSVAGSATLRENALALDMDVGTGDLDYAQIEKVLARLEDSKKKTSEKDGASAQVGPAASRKAAAPRLALAGDVRVSVDAFAYGSLVIKPVLVDFRLGGDALAARMQKAEICGVTATGEARFLSTGEVAVDVSADSSGSDINVPLACFGLKDLRMTGTYTASTRILGEGTPADLVCSLRGPLTFTMVKGRIAKATLMTRILGVLNATNLFKGKDKTRVGDAIPYDRISIEAELADGGFAIREAVMAAPSITMAAAGNVGLVDRTLDLTVLSHPLSTLDKIIQAIPVVRHILGHDFLAVAVKVSGTVGNPVVRTTPARDVGKGVVGILERTVTLPVKVFEPPPPERR